jgi:hypothetical protein
MTPFFAGPTFAMILGLAQLAIGAIDLATGSQWLGAFWLTLGVLTVVSGYIRYREFQRAERFSGLLGALAWMSAPTWGPFRGQRPAAVQKP